MARRDSLFDELMTVTAKLPWWMGALLAAISYLGFHLLASQPDAPAPQKLEGFGEFTRAHLYKTLAKFLQYVVPIAFLFGALGSWISRGRKRDSIDLFDAGDAASGAEGCPTCGSPMRSRTARRGSSRGERFYGCSSFPKCRGTRPHA
jgi:restriction system protein